MAMYLMRHTRNKAIQKKKQAKFDIVGLIILIIGMLSINLIITESLNYGLFSPFIMTLIVVFVVSALCFLYYEYKAKTHFIDLNYLNIKVIVVLQSPTFY